MYMCVTRNKWRICLLYCLYLDDQSSIFSIDITIFIMVVFILAGICMSRKSRKKEEKLIKEFERETERMNTLPLDAMAVAAANANATGTANVQVANKGVVTAAVATAANPPMPMQVQATEMVGLGTSAAQAQQPQQIQYVLMQNTSSPGTGATEGPGEGAPGTAAVVGAVAMPGVQGVPQVVVPGTAPVALAAGPGPGTGTTNFQYPAPNLPSQTSQGAIAIVEDDENDDENESEHRLPQAKSRKDVNANVADENDNGEAPTDPDAVFVDEDLAKHDDSFTGLCAILLFVFGWNLIHDQ